MSKKTPLFVLITLVLVTAAWYVVRQRAPETEVGTALLFPDLAGRVNDIATIELKSGTRSVTLAREGQAWVLADRDRYPAVYERVKRLVLNVAELRTIEPKTSRPDSYARIGVEDVDQAGATSLLLTLKDGTGAPVAALLVGREREGGATGALQHARYVRRAGEAQAYLATGELDASAEAMDWTDRLLADIQASRIREITIEHPGEPPVRLHRDKPETVDYTLADIPAGHRPKAVASLSGLATTFEQLRFDDVRAAAAAWPQEQTVATLRGFDGLIAKARSVVIDGRTWVKLEFAFDPAGVTAALPAAAEIPTLPLPPREGEPPADAKPAPPAAPSVADEVKALNERVGPWIYALPEFKLDMLTKTMAGLIAKIEEPKAPPATPPDPLTVEQFDSQGRLLPAPPPPQQP
jgi:hypothetical protein